MLLHKSNALKLNLMMQLEETISKIFTISNEEEFRFYAQQIFLFQKERNTVFNKWCSLINAQNEDRVPQHYSFLPISFFKNFKITTTEFEPAAIFESSGTTTSINSKHFVKDLNIYKKSFLEGFEKVYGKVEDWCIIGLLPSYLERNNSSLVFMVNELINKSKIRESGFYLNEFDSLANTLKYLEEKGTKTLLIGVSFALLDFIEKHSIALNNTIVMETGGMKGRREELTKIALHDTLSHAFGTKNIHSEYGMTELLSQAYSKGDGRFYCPPWMKVLVRDEEDPLLLKKHGRGALNIIDLANIYSCSFIATEDAGIVYEDGSFEVIGRLDNSDIRGCSLLTA